MEECIIRPGQISKRTKEEGKWVQECGSIQYSRLGKFPPELKLSEMSAPMRASVCACKRVACFSARGRGRATEAVSG